jgi:hypothetical protein
MQNVDNILLAMTELSSAWERKGDRRFIFLRCYGMMSTNMAAAIRDDRFDWPLFDVPQRKLRKNDHETVNNIIGIRKEQQCRVMDRAESLIAVF